MVENSVKIGGHILYKRKCVKLGHILYKEKLIWGHMLYQQLIEMGQLGSTSCFRNNMPYVGDILC